MAKNKLLLLIAPAILMILVTIGLSGFEHGLAALGNTDKARLMLGRAGIAAPYVLSAFAGIVFLFATAGARSIRVAGWSVVAGGIATIAIAISREAVRLSALAANVSPRRSVLSYIDPATVIGATIALVGLSFALRVAVVGNAAFASSEPKRIRGKRAMYGEADWMKPAEAAKLFSPSGGIVVGENYRVDRDVAAAVSFRADQPDSWEGWQVSASVLRRILRFVTWHRLCRIGWLQDDINHRSHRA